MNSPLTLYRRWVPLLSTLIRANTEPFGALISVSDICLLPCWFENITIQVLYENDNGFKRNNGQLILKRKAQPRND